MPIQLRPRIERTRHISQYHQGEEVDIDAAYSIWNLGLTATVFRLVASCRIDSDSIDTNGPFLPFTDRSRCCDRSPHSGHSLHVQDLASS